MAGNVQEWTTTKHPEKIFPNDDHRVIRGGSFSESYWYARTSSRVVGDARGGAPHVGFRCVRDVETETIDREASRKERRRVMKKTQPWKDPVYWGAWALWGLPR